MRIVIAGGGSGGHIYPALALLEAVRRKDPASEWLYLGTHHGLEARIVPAQAIPFRTVAAQGMLRRGPMQKAAAAVSALAGVWQARRLIRRFRADVVIGTGGYVTGPVGLAAASLRVPLVIQEQNVWPGMTNRWLARFADVVFTPYPESRPYFPKRARIHVVANPVSLPSTLTRAEARMELKLSPATKILLVTGGSQGALAINRFIAKVLPRIAENPEYGLIWATGARYHAMVQEEIARQSLDLDVDRFRIAEYFDQIAVCYRASDMFLGRAGAMSIADCMAYGLPMILVPSPNVSEDHQTMNARQLQARGIALAVAEAELPESGESALFGLFDDPVARRQMGERAHALYDQDAAATMAAVVLNIGHRNRGPRP